MPKMELASGLGTVMGLQSDFIGPVRAESVNQATVELSEPSGIFYAGSEVGGRFRLRCRRKLRCAQLQLVLKGTARAAWTSIDRGTTPLTRWEGEEETLWDSLTVWSPGSGCVPKEIEAPELLAARIRTGVLDFAPEGTHVFAFSFRLPETTYGRIRYELVVRAVSEDGKPTPLEKGGVHFSLPLSVIDLLDLNQDPALAEKTRVGHQQKQGSSLISKGSAKAQIQVPRTGFVSGEKIPFVLEIENRSNKVSVIKISVRFLQFVTVRGWDAKYCKTSEWTTVAELGELSPGREDIPSRNNGIWTDDLPIPVGITPTITNGTIGVEYAIGVDIRTQDPKFSIRFKCPLTIGSVPLKSEIPELSGDDNLPSWGPAIPLNMYKLPVPVYSKSMDFSESTTSIASEKKRFMPQYPYYRPKPVDIGKPVITRQGSAPFGLAADKAKVDPLAATTYFARFVSN